MKQNQNSLEQFENLTIQEVNADWNLDVFKKLKAKQEKKSLLRSVNFNLVLVVTLLGLNVFTFSNFIIREKKNAPKNDLKEVANSILVNTNSSKY